MTRTITHTSTIDTEDFGCPICGRADPAVLRDNMIDVEDGVPGVYTIGQCKACELIFLCHRPTVESLPRCYPDDYHVQVVSNRGTVSRWLYGLRSWVRLRRMLAATGGRFECLLEVGCGDGSFLRDLDRWCSPSVILRGIDFQATPIHERRLKVSRGALETIDCGGHFDAVIMFNVLEHLSHPVGSLGQIRSIMKQGGSLYGEVPNWNSLWRRFFPCHWQGLQVPRHMTFFTPKTLRATLEAAGFESIRLRGHFDPGDLAVTLCSWITDALGLTTPPRKSWFFLPVVLCTTPVAWMLSLVTGNYGCIEFTATRRL